jgi:hypothetical protein
MTDCVWCVIGEIVDRRRPPYGKIWNAHLPPGTTVYLSSLRDTKWSFRSAQKDRHIQLIFKSDPLQTYTQIFERFSNVADWRIEFVCDPAIVDSLREFNWPGFLLQEWDFVPTRNLNSAASVRELLEVLHQIRQGHPTWMNRLAQKCNDACPSFHQVADFLAASGEHEWSWIFDEIAIKLEAKDDELAVAMYLDLLHNKYGSFRDFYCRVAIRQPSDASAYFRKLFTDAATAITNIRWFRQHDVDRLDLEARSPND